LQQIAKHVQSCSFSEQIIDNQYFAFASRCTILPISAPNCRFFAAFCSVFQFVKELLATQAFTFMKCAAPWQPKGEMSFSNSQKEIPTRKSLPSAILTQLQIVVRVT